MDNYDCLVNPMESDCWGMIGEYDPSLNSYELSEHEYVEYKGTRSEHQDLEVYLPAGYDANRETPYRVIYLSHGAGGNETYWMNQPQGENVMDHMIAENPDQEAIVVSMDNTLYSWDYYQIGENVTKYIIPYMEANYNVSKEAKDRAFAGFSMGSMTTTYMAFHHADKFLSLIHI